MEDFVASLSQDEYDILYEAVLVANLRKHIRKDKKRVRNEAIKLLISQYLEEPIQERRILPKSEALNFYFHELFNLPEDHFQDYMRLSKKAFDAVYRILSSAVPDAPNKGYPLKMKFAAVVNFLSSTENIKDCAERFGIGISTLQGWYVYICDLMNESLKNAICWPAPGSEKSKTIQTDFAKVSNRQFPLENVVGAIDSCLITLAKKPACGFSAGYLSRNGIASVHLQAVVDARGRFLHVEAGSPGSLSDSAVLRNSSLFQTIGDRIQPPCFIVGDEDYPLLDWLITPYREEKGQLMDATRKTFNDIHSEALVVVANAFECLKARWRRLIRLSVDVVNVPSVILACCILHNVCLDFNLPEPNLEIPEPTDGDDVRHSHTDNFDPDEWVTHSSQIKRDSIAKYVGQK